VCARYARWIVGDELIEEFDDLRLPPAPFPIPASYNIAPQTLQPVIRVSPETQEPEIALMKWGLVPFWAKDQKVGYTTINARAEDVETKPAFRQPIQRGRCLVPANLFFEWQKLDAKRKQPYAIAMKDEKPLLFAGLWDRWSGDGVVLDTYTIITTAANEVMEPLHDRMPCILDRGEHLRWLEAYDPKRLPTDLLRPLPQEKMRCWPVGQAIGNVRNDEAGLCAEVPLPLESPGLFD
jgi:putative SOS response-associated peptidase YedK